MVLISYVNINPQNFPLILYLKHLLCPAQNKSQAFVVLRLYCCKPVNMENFIKFSTALS